MTAAEVITCASCGEPDQELTVIVGLSPSPYCKWCLKEMRCATCGGRGERTVWEALGGSTFQTKQEKCLRCNGLGHIL